MTSEYESFPRHAIHKIRSLEEKNESPKAKEFFEHVIQGLENLEENLRNHEKKSLLERAMEVREAHESRYKALSHAVRKSVKHSALLDMLGDYGIFSREDSSEAGLSSYFDSPKLDFFLRLCTVYQTIFNQYKNVEEFLESLESLQQKEEIKKTIDYSFSSFEELLEVSGEQFSVSGKPDLSREGTIEEKMEYFNRTFPAMRLDGKTVKEHMKDVMVAWAHYSVINPKYLEQRKKALGSGNGKRLWKSTRTGKIMGLLPD